MTNDLKLKLYPAVIGLLGICLVASLLFHVEVQVEQGATPSEAPPLDRDRPPSPSPQAEVPSFPPPVATPTTPADSNASPLAEPAASALPTDANARGGVRVSNQTEYPLRVALLHQQTASDVDQESTQFEEPVHWDFAPGEGRTKGLILSLPNNDLQLQSGDVLMAFAQDGSRRYWGPYVVGKTSLPTWNAATEEWQLILRP
ncbi:MAG: hypothetical protein Kow00121_18480 [Elainellaceae cyanobacterium]